jgi:prepilin-type N-terminal cleavage/methylation domain-containing protein/prepilin-type processing-associated H-X9-DG protein
LLENTMTRHTAYLGTGGRRRPARAFTLIEVLVVIGVISLLISILLPSINAAQRSAQRVACSSNLRSIGQAYTIYTGESKGKYPHVNTLIGPNGPWGRPNVTPALPIGRPDGIAVVMSQGYLPDARILYCPGGERTRENSTATTGNKNGAGIDNLKFWAEAKRTGVWDPGPGPGGMHQTGYAIWANWIETFEATGDIRQNWFASGLKEGAEKILASDHMFRGAADYEDWNGHLLKSRRPVGTTPFNGYPADPNPGNTVNFAGGNVLYNDGHVVWKGTTETVWRMRHTTGYDVFW